MDDYKQNRMIVIPADQNSVYAKYEVEQASSSSIHIEIIYPKSRANGEPDFAFPYRISTTVPFRSMLLPLKVIRYT
jgi:hypothetical protein